MFHTGSLITKVSARHGLPGCSKLCCKMSSDFVRSSSSIPFTLLSALAICISYADRANMSTAIIPMAEAFNWDSFFSGLVLSSFWIGYGLTQVVGGGMSDRYGGERVLTSALILWSVCTALTPTSAAAGNSFIILMRLALGAGEGMALPAVHSMISKYVDKPERSISASVVTASCYLGSVISNLACPIIIKDLNWEYVFWLFAVVPALLWLPLWIRFVSTAQPVIESINAYRESESLPSEKILNDRITHEDDSDSSIGAPLLLHSSSKCDATSLNWMELLKFKAVWAIILAQYCNSWGMVGLLSWMPTYFADKYDIPVSSLGSFTVLPYVLQLVIAILAGYLADYLIGPAYKFRVLWVRHWMQVTGMLIPAACLTVCATLPTLSVEDASLFITLGSAASALTVAGVSCSQFDISPKNAGAIFGIGNTAGCLAGAIAVPASGWLYDYTNSWDMVFLLFSAHYLIGALLWFILASDKPLSLQTADIDCTRAPDRRQ